MLGEYIMSVGRVGELCFQPWNRNSTAPLQQPVWISREEGQITEFRPDGSFAVSVELGRDGCWLKLYGQKPRGMGDGGFGLDVCC